MWHPLCPDTAVVCKWTEKAGRAAPEKPGFTSNPRPWYTGTTGLGPGPKEPFRFCTPSTDKDHVTGSPRLPIPDAFVFSPLILYMLPLGRFLVVEL